MATIGSHASAYDAPIRLRTAVRALSTHAATVASFLIALHVILVLVSRWLIFEQFQLRTPAALQDGLATAFLSHSVRVTVAELAAVAVCGLMAVWLRSSCATGRRHLVLGASLISYAPITLYSLIAVGALVAGWDLKVWVLSGAMAAPDDIAATIREALPVVLEPLSAGRHVATAAMALTFVVLQRRMSGISLRRAAGAAIAVSVVMTLALVSV